MQQCVRLRIPARSSEHMRDATKGSTLNDTQSENAYFYKVKKFRYLVF